MLMINFTELNSQIDLAENALVLLLGVLVLVTDNALGGVEFALIDLGEANTDDIILTVDMLELMLRLDRVLNVFGHGEDMAWVDTEMWVDRYLVVESTRGLVVVLPVRGSV
jgi:hypothetical protein